MEDKAPQPYSSEIIEKAFGFELDYYLPDNLFGNVETILAHKGIFGTIIPRIEISNHSPVDSNFCNLACSIIDFSNKNWGNSYPIYICQIENSDLQNAMCLKINDCYIIAHFSGLTEMILRSSMCFLSCEDGQNIFECAGLGIPIQINNDNFDKLSRLGNHPKIEHHFDENLRYLALGVYGSIIFHELGHILNGHLDFIEKLDKNYQENGILIWNNESSILKTRQALEYDADAFSSVGWINFAWKHVSDKSIIFPSFLTKWSNDNKKIAQFSLICSCVMFIHDDIVPKKDPFSYLDKTHARSDVRSWSSLVTIFEKYRCHLLTPIIGIDQFLIDIFFHIVKCAILIRGYKIDDVSNFNYIFKEYGEYFKIQAGRWSAIRDKLQEISPSTIGNLAPANGPAA